MGGGGNAKGDQWDGWDEGDGWDVPPPMTGSIGRCLGLGGGAVAALGGYGKAVAA